MRINLDKAVCIGAGQCVLSSPAVFDQDEDGTVVLLVEAPPAELDDDIRSAVSMCPSGAISLEDE
jgi:ferredoxin